MCALFRAGEPLAELRQRHQRQRHRYAHNIVLLVCLLASQLEDLHYFPAQRAVLHFVTILPFWRRFLCSLHGARV